MTKVYLLIRGNHYAYANDDKIILGIFSTPEKATDAANEYVIKEWKENCEKFSYRCPKTPLMYNDVYCKGWTFLSDVETFSDIMIVDYDFDTLRLDH